MKLSELRLQLTKYYNSKNLIESITSWIGSEPMPVILLENFLSSFNQNSDPEVKFKEFEDYLKVQGMYHLLNDQYFASTCSSVKLFKYWRMIDSLVISTTYVSTIVPAINIDLVKPTLPDFVLPEFNHHSQISPFQEVSPLLLKLEKHFPRTENKDISLKDLLPDPALRATKVYHQKILITLGIKIVEKLKLLTINNSQTIQQMSPLLIALGEAFIDRITHRKLEVTFQLDIARSLQLLIERHAATYFTDLLAKNKSIPQIKISEIPYYLFYRLNANPLTPLVLLLETAEECDPHGLVDPEMYLVGLLEQGEGKKMGLYLIKRFNAADDQFKKEELLNLGIKL